MDANRDMHGRVRLIYTQHNYAGIDYITFYSGHNRAVLRLVWPATVLHTAAVIA